MTKKQQANGFRVFSVQTGNSVTNYLMRLDEIGRISTVGRIDDETKKVWIACEACKEETTSEKVDAPYTSPYKCLSCRNKPKTI